MVEKESAGAKRERKVTKKKTKVEPKGKGKRSPKRNKNIEGKTRSQIIAGGGSPHPKMLSIRLYNQINYINQ